MDWIRGRVPLVMAAIQAFLALLIGFGLSLSADQVALIMAFVAALLGLVTYTQVSPKTQVPTAPAEGRPEGN